MDTASVLIVEDELLVAFDIEESLRRNGYNVVGVAESCDEAVALAQSKRPDIVLMDIKLRGERDGVAAARTIRDRWQIPVVFLTANADEQTLRQARSAGPYGFLTKPFRKEELTETVRIALDQHRGTKKLFASARWLTTLLDSLSDAVIATDEKALVQYLNPTAEALTGWTPIEAVGRPIAEVYSLSDSDGRHVDQCLLKRALATGETFEKRRFTLAKKSGAKVCIEDSATPILEGSEVIGAVTIFSDITDRIVEERKQELQRERLEDEAQTATAALGQTRAELRALAANLMQTQEEERRRISRELHDDIGQQAALVSILMDTVAEECSSESPSVSQLRSQLSRLSEDLREISHRLHPSAIADLGLEVALEDLAEQERSLGRDVIFTSTHVPHNVSIETATSLYRIAQEGLRNAAKHASGAAVRVTLSAHDKELQLRIKDTGPGFVPVEAHQRSGLGLVSMQERARLAGGSLLLSTRLGEGTVVLVRTPHGE